MGLGPARRRRLCRLAAGERAGRRLARRRRTRSRRCGRWRSPVRRSSCRRSRRCRSARASVSSASRIAWRSRAPALTCRQRILAPLEVEEPDFVAVAERFLGAPYLWGGKTALGLDCSGLVQVALTACGVSCPRDSDMQEQALGAAVGMAATIWPMRSAATSSSGKATSPSCATPLRSFTPMLSIWRLRSSRSPPRSRVSAPTASMSPACGGSKRSDQFYESLCLALTSTASSARRCRRENCWVERGARDR